MTVPRRRLAALEAGEGSRTMAEAEEIAGELRERIYATLAAVAALAALLSEDARATAAGAIASVSVTVPACGRPASSPRAWPTRALTHLSALKRPIGASDVTADRAVAAEWAELGHLRRR